MNAHTVKRATTDPCFTSWQTRVEYTLNLISSTSAEKVVTDHYHFSWLKWRVIPSRMDTFQRDGGDDMPLVIATVSSKGGGTGSQVNIYQEMETHINLSRLTRYQHRIESEDTSFMFWLLLVADIIVASNSDPDHRNSKWKLHNWMGGGLLPVLLQLFNILYNSVCRLQ